MFDECPKLSAEVLDVKVISGAIDGGGLIGGWGSSISSVSSLSSLPNPTFDVFFFFLTFRKRKERKEKLQKVLRGEILGEYYHYFRRSRLCELYFFGLFDCRT